MSRPKEYELTFPHPGQDDPDRVVVHRTGSSGPGGSEVYTDESGIVRAEISDEGEVRMIQTGGRQTTIRPSRARPLG
ncbi:DUF6296 family protein [Streptomyces sp. SL13]|jgi:hypothetical protein|uniref:DUF6296 family protein n=1 Tax=Streptantibioticus silvisoli TaxID=2705255 RepID=A0AA90H086_9ACTN|nr:DUF6296 family protein [Streptantibioticus silvisoli]MDI5966242.1 DUF6296 family protein [Streptantibioticus silvisoli]MDI5971583.1 DUF6296 family protein [Streptantibioticus silvisoli]